MRDEFLHFSLFEAWQNPTLYPFIFISVFISERAPAKSHSCRFIQRSMSNISLFIKCVWCQTGYYFPFAYQPNILISFLVLGYYKERLHYKWRNLKKLSDVHCSLIWPTGMERRCVPRIWPGFDARYVSLRDTSRLLRFILNMRDIPRPIISELVVHISKSHVNNL